MKHSLQVYVSDCCPGSDEARAMAQMMSAAFPELRVQIINLDQPGTQAPMAVFATPTYLLDGELLWLGNPRREEAINYIHALLNPHQEA
jgi:hypothetical protein